MAGYSFLDDSFIRNPMPVYPGANQPCRLLQCNRIVTARGVSVHLTQLMVRWISTSMKMPDPLGDGEQAVSVDRFQTPQPPCNTQPSALPRAG
jgi:hypothetical protein